MQATKDVKLPNRKSLAKLFLKLTTDLIKQIKNTLPSLEVKFQAIDI